MSPTLRSNLRPKGPVRQLKETSNVLYIDGNINDIKKEIIEINPLYNQGQVTKYC